MPTGESSAKSEVCRPCPLSKVGCGPEAGSEAEAATTCSPGAPGVVFLLPLGAGVLGAALAENLLGAQPLAQLLGALFGLTAGAILAASLTRLLRSLEGAGKGDA